MFTHIKNEMLSDGYVVVDEQYLNNRMGISSICPEGHYCNITWSNWKSGCRCKTCSVIKRRYDISVIKESFEVEGYTLTTTVYKNAHSKLDYICPEGHEHSISWSNWKNNDQRCPSCYDTRRSRDRMLGIDVVRFSFELEGYELLTSDYEGSNTPLHFKCPSGHEHSIKWNNWQQGQRCGVCSGRYVTLDDVKQSFGLENYVVLSDTYINNRNKIKYQCPDGHIHKISWREWTMGNRCAICSSMMTTSKLEEEVKSFVNELGVDYIENDRTMVVNTDTGNNLELDIWIPDKMKAIEVNGDYWHSTKVARRKDFIKSRECKKKGIDLLIIKECNWCSDKELEMGRIREHILETNQAFNAFFG